MKSIWVICKKIVVTFVLIFSATSSADLPYIPCSGSGAESYSYGINFGFWGQGEIPSPANPMCFQLGQAAGSKLNLDHANNIEVCRREYMQGKQQAMLADSLNSSPDEGSCLRGGYEYGFALLAVSARRGQTGIVGSACVQAYNIGFYDDQVRQQNHSYSNNQEAYCYKVGLQDALAK